MAESKATNPQTTELKSTGIPAAGAAHQLNLRLAPANNSDQPVISNICNVQLAPGLAYIDFGFIEPAIMASLPRLAQQGGKMPEQINGRLAARIAVPFDGLANLQQQLTRAMEELAKAAKAQAAGQGPKQG